MMVAGHTQWDRGLLETARNGGKGAGKGKTIVSKVQIKGFKNSRSVQK
jgi:hypothetical protein